MDPESIETTSVAELTTDQWIEKLKDSSSLPKYSELNEELKSVFQRNLFIKGDDPDYEKWKRFVENKESPVYEIWTEEYIEGLSNYLVERAESLQTLGKKPLTVLEVGAGDGKLSHFLQQKLEEKLPGVFKIIATDSGEDKIKTDCPIEIIDYKQALNKYQPAVVICSWMPLGVDFTAVFRATPSVREYILIGEINGCCGNRQTWGYAYEKDGFEKEWPDDLQEYQVSRINLSQGHCTSATVVFRRIGRRLAS